MKKILTLVFLLATGICTRGQKTAFRHLGIEEGLSQNMITAICQDHEGYMWFGTRDGLNRYDGYAFVTFKSNPRVANSVSDNHITALYEDPHKNLWVGTMHGGLQIYRKDRRGFFNVKISGLDEEARFVSTITGDGGRYVVVSYLSGHVVRIELPQEQWTGDVPVTAMSQVLLPSERVSVPFYVFVSRNKLLWVNSPSGLNVFSVETLEKKNEDFDDFPTYVVDYDLTDPLPRKKDDSLLPFSNNTQEIKEDDHGNIWITSARGLYRIDSKKKEIVLYRFSQSTTSVLPVTSGTGNREIWAGTLGQGLAILHPESGRVEFRPNSSFGGDELTDMLFRVICKSKDGTIWLGTNGRGVISHSPRFSLFSKGPLPRSINESNASRSIYALMGVGDRGEMIFSTLNEFVHADDSRYSGDNSFRNIELATRSLAQDRDGFVWFGNSKGLFRYDWKKKQISSIPDTDSEMILNVYVAEDKTVWYTTHTALCSYHPEKERRTRTQFIGNQKAWMQSILYALIQPDIDGSLWIGTTNGLFHFDKNQEAFVRVYTAEKEDANSLASNEIKSILPDPFQGDKYLWVGTTVGLSKLDRSTGKFKTYSTVDGLSNNMIYGILGDEAGRLWLSTNHGISVFDPKSESFMNFDISNGLQSNEFNTGAYYKSPKGEMFFGGINGYNRFFPKDVLLPQNDMPIVVSDIRLLGNELENYHFSPGIRNALRHDQNNVSITLAVLDFAAPGKIRYAYRIANRDTSWINIGNNRNVTLTNLSPGTYVFQARGTDGFGRWGNNITEMRFEILPPWWNSFPARIVYVFLIGLTLYLFWERYKRRLEEEQRMQAERQNAEAIMELDRVKTRFLANITHEFRTPLTLISGQLERLKEQQEYASASQQLGEMQRNSEFLLRLINQLMDLSKLESGEFKVRYHKKDILADLRVSVFSFYSYAEQKGISLSLDIDPATEQYLSANKVAYDESIFFTVINNLLSNACKFTDRNGSINVRFNFDRNTRELCIRVADTGAGIAADELPRIFDRFYQVDSSTVRSYEGSGIGLSLIKELAVLHGGEVSVESTPGEGSIFYVKLKEGDCDETSEVVTAPAPIPLERPATVVPSQEMSEDSPLILIVEDHPDLRRFIRESLGKGYRFAEAINGAEGLEAAVRLIPDLIISDVMMPHTDGFDFCSAVKGDPVTSHVPVILLTARVAFDDKLTGLTRGADDYLTKPFSPSELNLRVHNMISGRRILAEKHRQELTPGAPVTAALPDESTFMTKLVEVVGQNMGDSTFGVEALAKTVNLSPSQLQRKLKAISGCSPQMIIQQVRMEKAIALLQANEKHVADVAFIVGYENPGYFSKVFKKHFGFLPSEKEQIKAFRSEG